MTTEHRIASEADDRPEPAAALNDCSDGNRRTQRMCHKAASVIETNTAVVPQKMRVAHIIRQRGLYPSFGSKALTTTFSPAQRALQSLATHR